MTVMTARVSATDSLVRPGRGRRVQLPHLVEQVADPGIDGLPIRLTVAGRELLSGLVGVLCLACFLATWWVFAGVCA